MGAEHNVTESVLYVQECSERRSSQEPSLVHRRTEQFEIYNLIDLFFKMAIYDFPLIADVILMPSIVTNNLNTLI